MEKREVIIDAAKKAFRQYGIFKTTLEDIGYKCGVKKNSLYYYFKNKEDLLKAVTHSEYTDFLEGQKKIISQDLPFDKLLREYFLFRLNESLKFFSDYDLVKMENQLAYHDIFHEEGEFLVNEECKLIKSMVMDKVSPKTDVKSLIMVITSINQGLLYKRVFMNQKNENIEEEIDSIIQTLFNGIKCK